MLAPPGPPLRSDHPPHGGEGVFAGGATVFPPLNGEGRRNAPGRGDMDSPHNRRSAVSRARSLRKAMTPQEVLVWLRLRELKAQGFRFRRQVPLRGYILDFACFQCRLIVEIDGLHHGFDGQARHDQRRDAIFADEGFLTLRFTNQAVANNLDGIIETVFRDGQPRLSGVLQ